MALRLDFHPSILPRDDDARNPRCPRAISNLHSDVWTWHASTVSCAATDRPQVSVDRLGRNSRPPPEVEIGAALMTAPVSFSSRAQLAQHAPAALTCPSRLTGTRIPHAEKVSRKEASLAESLISRRQPTTSNPS